MFSNKRDRHRGCGRPQVPCDEKDPARDPSTRVRQEVLKPPGRTRNCGRRHPRLCCAVPPNLEVTATRRLSSEYQWPRAGPCEVDGASVGRENSGKVARTEDPVAASTRGLWHWRLKCPPRPSLMATYRQSSHWQYWLQSSQKVRCPDFAAVATDDIC